MLSETYLGLLSMRSSRKEEDRQKQRRYRALVGVCWLFASSGSTESAFYECQ